VAAILSVIVFFPVALAACGAVDGGHDIRSSGAGLEPEICLSPVSPSSVLRGGAAYLQFPSGHSLFSFCFYGVLAVCWRAYWIQARARPDLDAGGAAGGGIGLSRIYLGVHYPSDVIAGYLAASLWVSTLLTLDRMRMRHKRSRGAGAVSQSFSRTTLCYGLKR